MIMNDPHFVLRAAAHYGHTGQHWAPQYLSGKFLAEALAGKENEEMLSYERRETAEPGRGAGHRHRARRSAAEIVEEKQ